MELYVPPLREHGTKAPAELCRGLSCSQSSTADLHRGLSCSRSPSPTCADVSAALKFDYPISQISEHPECTSITAGAFRRTWECSCRVWEHSAKLQESLEASGSIEKHWWGQLECLRRFHVASGLMNILLMEGLQFKDRSNRVKLGIRLQWLWLLIKWSWLEIIIRSRLEADSHFLRDAGNTMSSKDSGDGGVGGGDGDNYQNEGN